jgi:hypothetical protein
MRYFIHVVTDQERIVDPEGAEFPDLTSARTEAVQSARDLMAEELRCGRPIPFGWRAQVADADGKVVLTLPFSQLVFGEQFAAELSRVSRPRSPEVDLLLIERARATFARARKSHADIRDGLNQLRAQVRQLARYTTALHDGSI